MKKPLTTLAFLLLLGTSSRLWADTITTPIYTVFSDDGISAADAIDVFGPAQPGDAGGNRDVSLDSTVTSPAPPEGIRSMKATTSFACVSGYCPTWGIYYPTPQDLSVAYGANGQLRLWANCTSDNFNVFVQYADKSQESFPFASAFKGAFNQWLSVEIPINIVSLKNITSPFGLTLNQPGMTCYIDNVRYVAASPGATLFSATVKDIANPATTGGNITWSVPTLPAGWVRANQYIDLEIDDPNDLSWGVEIYTDNTHASVPFVSAVPSGQVGSNPMGLVNAQKTSVVLPMAWSVKAGTDTPVNAEPTAAEPNNNGIAGRPTDKNAFQWHYMEDAATPAIDATGTTAFSNDDPAVFVKNNLGIHFGQSPTEVGSANPPNYIYLEANFSTALAAQTYQTNALIVELFHE